MPPIGSLCRYFPKSFPVMTGSGQRQLITHCWRSCSWDVFPYDLLPNQLRPVDLLLGQVSKGDRGSGGRGKKNGHHTRFSPSCNTHQMKGGK